MASGRAKLVDSKAPRRTLPVYCSPPKVTKVPEPAAPFPRTSRHRVASSEVGRHADNGSAPLPPSVFSASDLLTLARTPGIHLATQLIKNGDRMSNISDAAATGGSDIRVKGGEQEVLRIHSNCVSQRQLTSSLRKICKDGTFSVEMRHNVYTIYLLKDDVAEVTALLYGDGRLPSHHTGYPA